MSEEAAQAIGDRISQQQRAAAAAAARNIAQARAIVIAASQLAWSLYASGDLSVDQHGPIGLALGVAELGIRDVEELTDRLQVERERAEQAEARAAILQAQLGGWEAQCAAQVEAAYAAYHALSSYAHGNSAPDLAIEVLYKLEEVLGTDAGRLLLTRLALYQEQLQLTRDWIRKAGHRDDCHSGTGAACTCGFDKLVPGGADGL